MSWWMRSDSCSPGRYRITNASRRPAVLDQRPLLLQAAARPGCRCRSRPPRYSAGLIAASDTSCPGTGSSGSGSKPISSGGTDDGGAERAASRTAAGTARARPRRLGRVVVDRSVVAEEHREIVEVGDVVEAGHGRDRCRSARSCRRSSAAARDRTDRRDRRRSHVRRRRETERAGEHADHVGRIQPSAARSRDVTAP